jgi:Xaa-Pro aminopeptidase
MNPEFEKRLEFLGTFRGKADAVVVWNNSDSIVNPNFQWLAGCSIDGVFYYDFDEPKIFASEMELRRIGSWVKGELMPKDFWLSLKGKVAIDAQNITAGLWNKVKAKKIDASADFAEARSIKTQWEIRRIEGAVKVAKEAYRAAEKKGTEAGVRANVDFEILKRGAEPSFPTIVASGKNIEAPHHVPGLTEVSSHLLIDWGARSGGYCSDTTRTQGSTYQDLLEKILEEAYELIMPGAKCADLHNFVVKKLGKLSKHFIHSLGHGVGTAVHELPRLSASSADVLQEGMVFTIEPGLYLPGGLRIENMFLCTGSGFKLLTDF